MQLATLPHTAIDGFMNKRRVAGRKTMFAMATFVAALAMGLSSRPSRAYPPGCMRCSIDRCSRGAEGKPCYVQTAGEWAFCWVDSDITCETI